MQHDWPDHFPEECPPNASDFAEGRVYRFVADNPPAADDFLSWKQLNPRKDYGLKACQSCGLSVLLELDQCHQVRRQVPALRSKYIAFGDLKTQHGQIQKTPSNNMKEHYTWWLPKTVEEPWQLFRIAEEL